MYAKLDAARSTDALDQLLGALLAHEAKRLPPYEAEARRAALGDALKESDYGLREALLLAADPVGSSIRMAIASVGEALHMAASNRGLASSVGTMRSVAEDAAKRDEDNYGFRMAVIDRTWDGIGGWLA